jgi:hypothetical protein
MATYLEHNNVTEYSYIALQAPAWEQSFARPQSPYFDHMGFIVEDLADVVQRLKDYPFRIREVPDSPGYKKSMCISLMASFLRFYNTRLLI